MKKISVRSRNKSCAPLKELEFPVKVVYRMGSTTPLEQITKQKNVIEINSVKGCAYSNDKSIMRNYIKDAVGEYAPDFAFFSPPNKFFYKMNNFEILRERFGDSKLIVKHVHSSGGKGIYFYENVDALAKDIDKFNNHVVEKWYPYVREYRLHVAKDYGCFYAARKMLRNDAVERWHRHNNNSVFIYEENPMFDKPTNWDLIVEKCEDVLFNMKLDIACFDVKVQSSKYKNPKFIIMETNTAPGLNEVGIQKYKEIINKIVYDRM